MADKMRQPRGTWPKPATSAGGGSIALAAANRPTLLGYRLLLRSSGAVDDVHKLLSDPASMAPSGRPRSHVVIHIVGSDPREVLCPQILRESCAEVIDCRAGEPLLALPECPLLLYDGPAPQGLSAVWRELIPIAGSIGANLVVSDSDHQLAANWCRSFGERVFHHAAIEGRGVLGLPSRCTRFLSDDASREIAEDLEDAAVRFAFARDAGLCAARGWFRGFPIADLQPSLYCLSHDVVAYLSRQRRLQAYFASHQAEGWAGDLLVVFEIVAACRFLIFTETVLPQRPAHPSTITFKTLARKWLELEEYLNVEFNTVQQSVTENLESHIRSDSAARHNHRREAIVQAVDDVCRSYRQAFRATALADSNSNGNSNSNSNGT